MDSSASSQTPPPSTASSPKSLIRSEHANPHPTTFVQADTFSFKQVVQKLTGSPSAKPDAKPQSAASPSVSSRLHSTPPIKPGIAKKPGSGSSGFKLYERRNSLNNLKINPLHPLLAFSVVGSDILSPSILDLPALVLSPITPLTHDPFTRSPTISASNCPCNKNAGSPDEKSGDPGMVDSVAEERGIREKGFFLHPSPRDMEPRLLPLFPVTSPMVSGD